MQQPHSASSANTRDFRNNILYNARSNNSVGATGKHYVICLNYSSIGTMTMDYNDYYTNGTGGILGRFYNSDIVSVPQTPGFNENSQIINPGFINPGSTLATDYKIGVDLVGISGTEITTDYGLATRNACTSMGAWEHIMKNKWKGTIDSNWSTAKNWLLQVVPSADENIYIDAVPYKDCILDKDYGVSSITNSQSTYKIITNGHKLTIKGALEFTNGAQIDASANSSSIEFAGSSTQAIPAGAFYGNKIYNLVINNANNVTFFGTLNLLNRISTTLGKLDATTNSPILCYAGESAQAIEPNTILNNEAINLTIDNPIGVSINTDFKVNNSLTINSGKLLTIPTNKSLNVMGSITNNAGVSGIIIKSEKDSVNGSLIFNNASNKPVSATVEMYSKACAQNYDAETNKYSGYKWQYFGIPVRIITADPTFAGSYVRQYFETKNSSEPSWISLSNLNTLTSLSGYEITQHAPTTLSFQGELENGSLSRSLTYTENSTYPGMHILGNPYTAAININELTYVNAQKSVYLYNTGSSSDWEANSASTEPGFSPEQYVVAPKETAGTGGIPGEIPSMQGFMVVANPGGGTINIPYTSVATKNTKIQRAPSLYKSSAEEKVYTIINVNGSKYSDKMWLFTDPTCTHSYDNGWDGYKMVGSLPSPQIYAIEPDGLYQVNAVDNINNTEIGFQAGVDSVYTLTFNHQNLNFAYQTLYLVDELNNKTTDISANGTTYTFKTDSATTTQRIFKITTDQGISTDIKNSKTCTDSDLKILYNNKAVHIQNFTNFTDNLVLYNILGKIVLIKPFNANYETVIPIEMNTGLYIANAQTTKKSVITNLIVN